MRTEVRKEVIEKTVYIHDDGTEFDTPQECMFYEQNIAYQNARKILEQIPNFKSQMPCSSPDVTFRWLYCRTMDELVTSVQYYLNGEAYKESEIDTEEIREMLPGWFLINYDYDGYGYVSTAEEILGMLDHYIVRTREKCFEMEKEINK